jgi:hypothetical protein
MYGLSSSICSPPNLLEQLGLHGLAVLLVLALLAPREQLAGSVPQLPITLAHLDGADGVISGDLLDRLRPPISSMATLAINSGL